MTSKCGKNKKVAHEAIAECFTDVLTTFDVFCDLLLNRATVTWNLFVLYNNETSYYYIKLLFISKYLNITRKPAFQCSLQRTRKKDIWRDLISIQNEAISLVAMRIKEFWLVLDNHATVKPGSSPRLLIIIVVLFGKMHDYDGSIKNPHIIEVANGN